MWTYYGCILAIACGGFVWRLDAKRRLLSLAWPHNLTPSPMKKRCVQYFRHFGILSYDLYNGVLDGVHQPDGPFDVLVPNDQFNKNIGVIKIICRDPLFIHGERFFYDVRVAAKRGNDVGMTAVVLTTAPANPMFATYAATYDVALIDLSDLRHLATALRRVKAGQPAEYDGKSPVIANAFKTKTDRREEARALEALARAAEKQHDWVTAEQYWREAQLTDRGRWENNLGLAGALKAQNKFGEAVKLLRSAWSDFPKQMEIAAALARLHEVKGEWQEALMLWDEIIRRYPDRWQGYRGKIATLSKLDRAEEADQLLLSEAGNFPDDVAAASDLAMFAERKCDWNSAEAGWRSYIAVDDGQSWVHARLARAMREQGKFKSAQDFLVTSIGRFPADPDLLKELGRVSEASEKSAAG